MTLLINSVLRIISHLYRNHDIFYEQTKDIDNTVVLINEIAVLSDTRLLVNLQARNLDVRLTNMHSETRIDVRKSHSLLN